MQFDSIHSFRIWLTIEGHGELKQWSETLDLSVLEALGTIYQKYGEPRENAELHDIVGSLGEAVAELMQLSVSLSVSLSAIADKKAFVTANALTLYSLVKESIAQSDSNLSRTLRPMGGALDESLTDPVVKKVIEGVLAAGPQHGIHL